MYYVYIIRNEEKGTYVGYTDDIERRIREHNYNHKGYTGKGDWQCVYYEAFLSEKDARNREHQLKHNGNAKRWLKARIHNSLEDEKS